MFCSFRICFQLAFKKFSYCPSNLEILFVSFFCIYWMTFTWKRRFCELEENVKFQNKNGNGKMSQKYLSIFANSPEKIRILLTSFPVVGNFIEILQ